MAQAQQSSTEKAAAMRTQIMEPKSDSGLGSNEHKPALSSETQALLERMSVAYEASSFQQESNPYLEEKLRRISSEAKLYFRYHIPVWPPKMLVRKLMRRLIFPFMIPQVHFNETVGEVLHNLRERCDRLEQSHKEAIQTIIELEDRLDEAQGEIVTLHAQSIAVNGAAATIYRKNGSSDSTHLSGAAPFLAAGSGDAS